MCHHKPFGKTSPVMPQYRGISGGKWKATRSPSPKCIISREYTNWLRVKSGLARLYFHFGDKHHNLSLLANFLISYALFSISLSSPKKPGPCTQKISFFFPPPRPRGEKKNPLLLLIRQTIFCIEVDTMFKTSGHVPRHRNYLFNTLMHRVTSREFYFSGFMIKYSFTSISTGYGIVPLNSL